MKMRIHRGGIQRQSATDMLAGRSPVVVEIRANKAKPNVCLGEGRIQLQGALGRCPGLGQELPRVGLSRRCHASIVRRFAFVGGRVSRVDRESPLEAFERLSEARGIELGIVVTALQVCFVSRRNYGTSGLRGGAREA